MVFSKIDIISHTEYKEPKQTTAPFFPERSHASSNASFMLLQAVVFPPALCRNSASSVASILRGLGGVMQRNSETYGKTG